MEIVIVSLLSVFFLATAGSLGSIVGEYDKKHGGYNGLATLLLFIVSLASLVSLLPLGGVPWK